MSDDHHRAVVDPANPPTMASSKRLGDIPGLVICEGTVYPILSRFKRDGLVTTTLVESNEGPARKYYELLPGRREVFGCGRPGGRSAMASIPFLRRPTMIRLTPEAQAHLDEYLAEIRSAVAGHSFAQPGRDRDRTSATT